MVVAISLSIFGRSGVILRCRVANERKVMGGCLGIIFNVYRFRFRDCSGLSVESSKCDETNASCRCSEFSSLHFAACAVEDRGPCEK